MAGSAVAARYALALYQLAGEQNCLDPVAAELAALAPWGQDREVLAFAGEPRIPAAERERVILGALREASALTVSFVRVVVRRRRLALLPAIAAEFARLVDHGRGCVRARVASAVPLDAKQQQDLTDRLARLTGRTVVLETALDPALVGGLVIKAEGWQVDGSVARAFRDLRERLQGLALGIGE